MSAHRAQGWFPYHSAGEDSPTSYLPLPSFDFDVVTNQAGHFTHHCADNAPQASHCTCLCPVLRPLQEDLDTNQHLRSEVVRSPTLGLGGLQKAFGARTPTELGW